MLANKIGNVAIHPENQTAADKILKIFREHKVCPLLISQPQQGKTTVQIAVADGFIKTCKHKGETYQVILITNIADIVLRKQTRSRFGKAGLDDVEIFHHAELKNIILKDVAKRLIIIDECHIALGHDRPFHDFMKRCGIQYGKPISTWTDSRNYVLSVSATPYATKIREELDTLKKNPTFSTVDLEKAPEYFGLTDMHQKGRIKASGVLLNKDKRSLSPFLESCLNEAKTACENTTPGVLVIRSRGQQSFIIETICKSRGFSVKSFSEEDKNIDQLDDELTYPRSQLTIFLIKGALRAGKTLTTTKYIRGWIESKKSKPDALAQVAGRCCGYPDAEDNYSKFDDTFPIYCDQGAIQEAITFYGDNLIPRGNYNNKGYEENEGWETQFFAVLTDRAVDFVDEFMHLIAKTTGGNLSFGVSNAKENKSIDFAKCVIDRKSPKGRNPAMFRLESNFLDSTHHDQETRENFVKFAGAKHKVIFCDINDIINFYASQTEDTIEIKLIRQLSIQKGITPTTIDLEKFAGRAVEISGLQLCDKVLHPLVIYLPKGVSPNLSESTLKPKTLFANPAPEPFTYIPKGNNNDANGDFKEHKYQIKIDICSSEKEAIETARTIYGNDDDWKTHKSYVGHVSQNEFGNDICRSILDGTLPSARTIMFHMDSYHPSRKDSWDALIAVHPEYQGKFLVCSKANGKSTQIIITGVNEELIKEKSLLAN